MKWTKSYCGVQHLAERNQLETKRPWVSVNHYHGFSVLLKWFIGCGFSPIKEMFETPEQAKLAGEKWLTGQIQNL